MQRTFAILLSLVCAITLTACGDKGSAGGPVGSWTLDVNKMVATELAKRLEGVPESERAKTEALIANPTAREAMAKMFGSLKVDVEMASDKTFTVTRQLPGTPAAEKLKGSWTEKNGKLLITPVTKDGQPVTGDDATPLEGKIVASHLVLVTPEGGELPLKRK